VPIALILPLVDLLLIIHVIKTGRIKPWLFVITFFPGVGAALYVVMELIPDWTRSRDGRRAREQIERKLNPTGRYRKLREELAVVDTIANRAALAEECLAIARFDEARDHFESILAMSHGDDPLYMLGRARAEFGLGRAATAVATLEALKSRWPDYRSPEGHLLYARSLEMAGHDEQALATYDAVGRYFPGAEPRVRQARLLRKLGREAEAKAVAEDVVRKLKHAPAYARRNQKIWLAAAQDMARA
jgi:hypothetical protein